MRSKALTQLQINYRSYSFLWEQWLRCSQCSLTEEDVYIIATHCLNNFEITIDGLLMFYNRDSALEQINRKLVSDYAKYQHWIVIQLHAKLIAFADKHGTEILSTPIYSLTIPVELKTLLLKFKYNTLGDLLQGLSAEGFAAGSHFSELCNVLRFLNEEK